MRGQPPTTTDRPPDTAAQRFEEAYRSCGSAVLGYALRRSSSREDALDVVAETFTTAWRRRADMPTDPAEMRPWLFGIARWCSANVARSGTRSDRLGERLAASLTVPDTDPGTLHEDAASGRRVLDALGELSADDRELVTLIAWEGLTPAQAAVVLDVSAGTARVRLHRARARLRAALPTPTYGEETGRAH